MVVGIRWARSQAWLALMSRPCRPALAGGVGVAVPDRAGRRGSSPGPGSSVGCRRPGRGQQERQHAAVVDDGVGLGAPPSPGTSQRVVIWFSGNTIGAVPAGPRGVDVSAEMVESTDTCHESLPALSARARRAARMRTHTPSSCQHANKPYTRHHGPVPVGHVLPRTADPDPVTDPVDQGPQRPNLPHRPKTVSDLNKGINTILKFMTFLVVPLGTAHLVAGTHRWRLECGHFNRRMAFRGH